MSRSYISKDKKKYSFDYTNQVWIIDGKYQDCGHPATLENGKACDCYGRQHAGEKATIHANCH